MTGTEKQIKWAEDIIEIAKGLAEKAYEIHTARRKRQLVNEQIRREKGKDDHAEQHAKEFAKIMNGYENFVKYINEADDAAEIINNRGRLIIQEDDPSALIRWSDDAEEYSIFGFRRYR